MIMGIGVDMVSEARVARSIKRPGFLEKVYGPAERALLENRGMRPQTAAANFAAKEAFGKALGTGLLREFALCEAEALRDENGAPYFSFSGRAAALMQHYLGEALRLWGTGQVSAELKLAQEVLNWLRDKMGPGRAIPLADIYRNGPAAIRSAGTARRVMQLLTHHGWVVAAEHPTAREAFELVAV